MGGSMVISEYQKIHLFYIIFYFCNVSKLPNTFCLINLLGIYFFQGEQIGDRGLQQLFDYEGL